MSGPRNLRLLSFPSSDANFRDDVQRALSHLSETQTDDERRRQLLAELRPLYRPVEVVPQDEFAHLDLQPIRIWYVYRDGRVRPVDDQRERLYAALASARRTCDQSREVLSDALSVARAAGYPDPEPADHLEAAEQPA
jgi:hypothetical protein